MRFLFVDRILSMEEGKSIQGIKHITLDDDTLDISSSGQYFLTSSLLGETLGQLAAWNVMKTVNFKARPVAGILSKAKFTRPAFVGETVLLEANIDQLDESSVAYNAKAFVNNETILSLEGSIGPMLPMEQFIDEDIVKQQFTNIFRPGPKPETIAANIVQTSSHPVQNIKAFSAFGNPRFRHLFHFDKINTMVADGIWRAEKMVNFAAPYFADHFPRNPVLPLTVLLECQQNLAQDYIQQTIQKQYVLSEISRVKMKEFVHPGDIIQTELRLKNQQADHLVLQFVTELVGKRICTAEMTFVQEKTL